MCIDANKNLIPADQYKGRNIRKFEAFMEV